MRIKEFDCEYRLLQEFYMWYRLKTSETDGSFDMRNLEIRVLFASKTFSKFVLILVQFENGYCRKGRLLSKKAFTNFNGAPPKKEQIKINKKNKKKQIKTLKVQKNSNA